MYSYVVTGGARGIGGDIVRHMSSIEKCKVFYSYKREPDSSLENNINVYSHKADCSTYDGCQSFADYILSNTDQVSGLVNNVGVAYFGLINNTNISIWDTIHRTNVDSAVFMYQLLLSALVKAKGIVINISSLVHKRPSKGTGAYACSKAMMADLTKQMSLENESSGVEALTLSPGFILTEALQKPEYEIIRKKNLEQIPLHTFGKPNNISNVVYLLLTRTINCQSGSTVNITGGQDIFSY